MIKRGTLLWTALVFVLLVLVASLLWLPDQARQATEASGGTGHGQATVTAAVGQEAAGGNVVAASGVAASAEAASGVAASGVATSAEAASGVAASGVATSAEAASGPAASGVAASAAFPVLETAAPAEPRLPDEAAFIDVAETSRLVLRADPQTGHFQVVSRATGNVWRSYPDPLVWETETTGGIWRGNLLSPVMLEYVDASSSNAQSRLSSWMEERGTITFQQLDNGFRAVLAFPATAFRIPLEVRLLDDYIEVRVQDEALEEGPFSLLNLKAYPLFGAQSSQDRDGYMLLPDGSGALARFDQNRSGDRSIYREAIYGSDRAFYEEETNRNEVRLPVFGLKGGGQSFLAVLTGGEAYARVFAAPAGALGVHNWVTAEWLYRLPFFQNTSRSGNTGFYTYSKERFAAPSRSLRYYLLEGEQIDYPAMAAIYRTYLQQEAGAERLVPQSNSIPFFADLIAADLQPGALWDDYVVGTTTDEAGQIVEALAAHGITGVTAIYHGWQRNGYSAHGGLLPADRRIGGNRGLEQLAAAVQTHGGQLWLAANYSLNNTRRDGFWSLNDGLRNLAGTTLYEQLPGKEERVPLVSPRFALEAARDDLAVYKALGVDGVLFTGGIGSALDTDFNSRHGASRLETLAGQQTLLAETAQQLGSAAVERASLYTLPAAAHLHRLADDYSYDFFLDEAVPFAQITLHGLVTYTSEWGNLRDDYRTDFLRSVEYGAYPAYVFTAAPSGAFRKAHSIWYYSMHYGDWLEAAAEAYARLNEALGAVQDRFIVDHGTLAPGVKRTVYEGGHTVIVNYNETPFEGAGFRVGAQDFIVQKGGAAR